MTCIPIVHGCGNDDIAQRTPRNQPIERVTGHQNQSIVVGVEPQYGGSEIDDLQITNPIGAWVAGSRLEHDVVSSAKRFEKCKMRIAMAR
jgi:hypothetical protein